MKILLRLALLAVLAGCIIAQEIPECEEAVVQECCDPRFTETECKCENCDGPWFGHQHDDFGIVLVNAADQKCSCNTAEDIKDIIPDCEEDVVEKCCDPSLVGTYCSCGNCDGPWLREQHDDFGIVLVNAADQKCSCNTKEDIEEEEEEEDSGTGVEPDCPDGVLVLPCTGPVAQACCEGNPALTCEWVAQETTVFSNVVFENTSQQQQCFCSDTAEIEHGDATSTMLTGQCQGGADTSCNAFASLEINVIQGTCYGEAGASCEAVASAYDDIQEAMAVWVDKGVCIEGTASAAAQAVATAMASVWTDSSTSVTCDECGVACGWSGASGEAWAHAFAEATAFALATAESQDGQHRASCYADVRAFGSAVAEAAATASTIACTDGGTAEAYAEAFEEDSADVIATAFATATARVCGESDPESLCEGFAQVDKCP